MTRTYRKKKNLIISFFFFYVAHLYVFGKFDYYCTTICTGIHVYSCSFDLSLFAKNDRVFAVGVKYNSNFINVLLVGYTRDAVIAKKKKKTI